MRPHFYSTSIRLVACCLAASLCLGACALPRATEHLESPTAIDDSRLPPPDLELAIPGLGPCTDLPGRRLVLNSAAPVSVLVHGCFGSAGRFRALADVMAFHGQQSACFSYDDRASLEVSSGQLARAIEALSAQMPAAPIRVLGHSQGGLVARRAMIAERRDALSDGPPLRLVTVSAPFSGIRSARFCAFPALRLLTLGVNDLICQAISGDKWLEITYVSDLIRQPGGLHPRVRDHLMVVTDERGTCRRRAENGRCLESDFIFSLGEQYHPPVDRQPGVTAVEIAAGHVEIVGDHHTVPSKLIAALQEHGFIAPTPDSRRAAFERLLARLYLGGE
jgi:pimeloyl-ACP methyl ester carboxylesterase